ncbi:N-acetylmuramoyl-L-alanine amidase [Streptomyces sp. NPDC046203]|uniref:peptidoglycan recognition protein family protein n=1 Tax=Streptomyces sp. NPDC046203 TaxID=3154602 RepID=UPI003407B77F
MAAVGRARARTRGGSGTRVRRTAVGAALAATVLLAPQAAAYGVGVGGGDGAAGAVRSYDLGRDLDLDHELPGGIRTLALTDRGSGEAVLDRQRTEPFRLLGVTWDDPRAEVPGPIEVRTRDLATGRWSDWTELERHPAGLDGERAAGRGSTEPLWVGPSDGVEARIRGAGGESGQGDGLDDKAAAPLPAGLRVHLIDPRSAGEGTDAGRAGTRAGSDPDGSPTTEDAGTKAGDGANGAPAAEDSPTVPPSQPGPSSTAARPRVVTRAEWGADESEVTEPAIYLPAGRIKAAFVHHTDSRPYECSQSASIIQGILDYHVRVEGWRDIGYNFLVDKCGTIYEGRKGGIDQPVHGAHTYGWNAQTTGIAVIGDFSAEGAPQAALASVARIIAYKLGQYRVDPGGRTTLTSGANQTVGTRKYVEGDPYTFDAISGHRDGFATACPGDGLYGQLNTIRGYAAPGRIRGNGIGSAVGSAVGSGIGSGSAGTAESGPASFGGRYEAVLPRF